MSDKSRIGAAVWQKPPRLADLLLPEPSRLLRRIMAARQAESQDRAEWIEGVRQRLGLVTMGEKRASGDRVEWPAGLPDGPWETVSVHTIELPADWPSGGRAGGGRVSLGGPCPVHEDASVAPGGPA